MTVGPGEGHGSWARGSVRRHAIARKISTSSAKASPHEPSARRE